MADKTRPRRDGSAPPVQYLPTIETQMDSGLQPFGPPPLGFADFPTIREEEATEGPHPLNPSAPALRSTEDIPRALTRTASNNRGFEAKGPLASPSEYEGFDEPPSQRHPAHQVTRWGPPPPRESWTQGEEARYWTQQPWGYGPPRAQGYDERGTPLETWPEDPFTGPAPAGRVRSSSMRSTRSAAGQRPRPRGTSSIRAAAPPLGPPRGPPPRHVYWYEGSDDESEDSPAHPRAMRAAAVGGGGHGGGRGRGHGGLYSPSIEEMEYRLPYTQWMNRHVKSHFVAVLGEFCGTTMFLMMAFAGTLVANIGGRNDASNTTTNASTGFSPIVLLYIAASFGFSLMVNVWIFFRVSGGLFNPAVTLAMMLVKAISPLRAILLVFAQIVGSIFASLLVMKIFPVPFNVRTTLSAETTVARGVFIEALLTAELVFAIFMLAKEKHKATHMAPVGIGLALFAAELVGVYFTGGSLNPARSFGPCVVTGNFDQNHWVYWLGPAAGALIAVALYRVIKVLGYELANPGQDKETEHEAEQEEKKAEMGIREGAV